MSRSCSPLEPEKLDVKKDQTGKCNAHPDGFNMALYELRNSKRKLALGDGLWSTLVVGCQDLVATSIRTSTSRLSIEVTFDVLSLWSEN